MNIIKVEDPRLKNKKSKKEKLIHINGIKYILYDDPVSNIIFFHYYENSPLNYFFVDFKEEVYNEEKTLLYFVFKDIERDLLKKCLKNSFKIDNIRKITICLINSSPKRDKIFIGSTIELDDKIKSFFSETYSGLCNDKVFILSLKKEIISILKYGYKIGKIYYFIKDYEERKKDKSIKYNF